MGFLIFLRATIAVSFGLVVRGGAGQNTSQHLPENDQLILRRIIEPATFPPAIAPYSSALLIEGTLYISGITGRLSDGTLISGGPAAETNQTMKNIGIILDAVGTTFANLVKVTIFITDMRDFATINSVYRTFFPDGVFPARSAFQVGSTPVPGARLEIEAIAVLGKIVNGNDYM